MRREGRLAITITVTVALLAGGGYLLLGGNDDPPKRGDAAPTIAPNSETSRPDDVDVPNKAYLRDACALPTEWVRRIYRGWQPGAARAWDLVIVPHPPNYMGTFINTSHSAPYEFLQEVPLVLYGPGFVDAQGRVSVDRDVTIADLAPTYAELMGFDGWPERPSTSLTEVLKETDAAPKLIVTAVIDGGGWNALEQWPDKWPNIAGLIEEGVNVEGATVGSSPSITPATHTNLATGTFPRYHGVTAIVVRADDGSIVGSFSEDAGNPGAAVMDPTVSLRKTTLADLWDVDQDNEPKIGMLAAGNLQLGMVGYGSAREGGDKDIVAIRTGEQWATNPAYYSLPEYVNTEVPGPEQDIEAVDRADGEADGQWRGHAVDPLDASPAFAPWETRTMQAIFAGEGFGEDDVTDLFYVNYKAPDKAGHKWNMIAPEQGDTIESVDTAIGDLRQWLDENVGENEYLLVVTADHGQTPLEAGGWPLSRPEILGDLNARFNVDGGLSLIEQTSASSFFVRKDRMQANGVTPEEVSSFMSRYTIGDNIAEGAEVPEGFEDRTDERIFDAVFPGRELDRVAACTGVFPD
ncbi:MAG TPA: alkaline phosphatase family protein [Actinomycetota bacterium]